jgi:hypothetical protein
MNRQKKLLLLLFGLFLLSLGYSYWMMPEQRRVSFEVTPEKNIQTRVKVTSIANNRLRVDLLEQDPTRYKGAYRDIFNFKARQQPAKPKPIPTPVVTKPVQPKPMPVVTQVVRQQLARFTFLGFLIKDEQHTIFLSRGEDLFLVQEGDRFGDGNQFTAAAISPDKLSVSQKGDSRRIDILLVEKEPLIPIVQPVQMVAPPAVMPKKPAANTPRWKRNVGSGEPIKR